MSFSAPGDWAPARIGERHLLFASAAGPVMEIKWGPVRGRISCQRMLRRLSRRIGRQGVAFQENPLSPGWQGALRGFEAAGFRWDAGRDRAAGVVLYCAACRTASLIQFFQPPQPGGREHAAERLLASFRDHRDDDLAAWALYDVAALLPGQFRLTGHRFEAGRFVLQFRGPGCRLALYRWAPAGALLANRSLAEFARTMPQDPLLEVQPLAVAGLPGVEGRERRPPGRLRRACAWLGMSAFRRWRIWHVEGRNRILGVRLEGRRPIVEDDFLRIQYGMDGEKGDATPAFPG